MAADLRPECAPGAGVAASDLFLSFLAGTSPREFDLRRCDRLRHSVDAFAPMAAWPDIINTWHKLGEYDTLAQCDSQYHNNQTAPVDTSSIQITGLSELVDEGKNPISRADLEKRMAAIQKGIRDQVESERCIASDPNLARD